MQTQKKPPKQVAITFSELKAYARDWNFARIVIFEKILALYSRYGVQIRLSRRDLMREIDLLSRRNIQASLDYFEKQGFLEVLPTPHGKTTTLLLNTQKIVDSAHIIYRTDRFKDPEESLAFLDMKRQYLKGLLRTVSLQLDEDTYTPEFGFPVGSPTCTVDQKTLKESPTYTQQY